MKGSCLGALIGLGAGLILLFVVVPVLGGILISIPSVTEPIEDAMLCPDAVSIERDRRTIYEGAEAQGQQIELTCTFPDGRQ